MNAAVIVAGGSGERLAGDRPKQLRDLGGLPVLAWSVAAFSGHRRVEAVVVVLPGVIAAEPPEWLDGRASVVGGGATRAESVVRGVAAVPGDAATILVHDGVRPFVSGELIARVLDSAATRPTVPAVPVVDTIKTVDDEGRVTGTPARASLRAAQTPQGFPAELLRELHASGRSGEDVTDDSVACERAGHTVHTVEGDPMNFKITGPGDLAYARWLVETGVIPVPTL